MNTNQEILRILGRIERRLDQIELQTLSERVLKLEDWQSWVKGVTTETQRHADLCVSVVTLTSNSRKQFTVLRVVIRWLGQTGTLVVKRQHADDSESPQGPYGYGR